MILDIQAASRIEDIGQEAWDRLSSNRPFSSYAWYRFGEKVLSDSQPTYLVLSRCKQPAARAAFWRVRREPLPVLPPAARFAFNLLLKARPLFICRSPLADASGLSLPEGPRRDFALGSLLQAAREQARQQNASFVAFDYLEEDIANWSGWNRTFASIEVPEPGTRLVLPPTGFDAYLSGLSKGARKDYHRHTNRARDLGIEVQVLPRVASIPEALPLIRGVEKRHRAEPKPWTERLLSLAGEAPASAWIEARQDGRLVGCGLILEDRGVQIATLLGLDPTIEYVYFQLVYAALRHAFESGARVLRVGSGAYEFKQRLGFRLETNNHTVLAGNGAVFQRLGLQAAATA